MNLFVFKPVTYIIIQLLTESTFSTLVKLVLLVVIKLVLFSLSHHRLAVFVTISSNFPPARGRSQRSPTTRAEETILGRRNDKQRQPRQPQHRPER